MKHKLLLIAFLVYGLGWGQATLPVNATFSSVTTTGPGTMPNGFSQTGLGGYAGSLKFDTQGDFLVLFFNSNPGNLSFDIGVNNTYPGTIPATVTFDIQESIDGINYSNNISYTNVSGGNKTISNLNSCTRYIRWIYTIKPSGTNISIKNIVLNAATQITSTTYTTSWSNCTGPTASLDAIINGDLTTSGDLTCRDLTVNSGITLTVAAGTTLKVSGNLVNNGNIVFKSNNTSTGRFDSYSGDPIIGTGTVTMERYIDGKRAFRLLAPGVTTSGTIAANWQQQVFITGSTTGANGFDATTSGAASMFTFENSGWTQISDTDVLTLNAQKGYRILIRGDRTPSILTSPSNGNMNTPVTLRATGTMTTGDVIYTTLSNQDYTLVANPYISPINWSTVTKSGISDTYYVWDPNLGTGNQRGRFVSCDVLGNTSIISDNGSPNTDVDQYIQPGQAFFIQKSDINSNGTITVKESDKADTFTDVFRNANTTANSSTIDGKLGINLYESIAYSLGEYPIDGAVAISGNSFNTNTATDDTNKILSHGEQVAFVRENKQLGVEKVSAPQATDELAVASINLVADKSYTWSVVLQDNFSNEDAYLYDAFTQSYHPLTASNTTVIPFVTTIDAASINENRFKIVFQNTTLNTPTFDNQISLYPNPSNGANGFYMTNITASAKVALFTVLGQSVPVSTALNGTTLQVKPMHEVAKGIYVVQVIAEDGATKQVKWIVE